jgi:glycosyltransferase involved in cell wall biosynthesis
VIQVADYGGPYPGSFVPMVRAASGEVRARGWSPEVVFSDDARERTWLADLAADEIPVSFVQRGKTRDVARDLARHAHGADRVLFHTHFTTFDIPAALAARRAPLGRVVWHLHSHVRRELPVRIRNVVKYTLSRRHVDAILGVAPDVAETAIRRGARSAQVVYFPNAIDTAAIASLSNDERGAARRRLGIREPRLLLLHYAWDWERKGGDLFLGAVASLRGRGRDVVGATVGGGDAARSEAERLGLGAAFMDIEPTGALRDVLAAADVFVSSSRAEGMPYSVAEALSAGVPVAATAIPGQEVLCAGLGACRLAALTPGSLADAVEELVDRSPATASSDASAARRRMVERHDLKEWSTRLADLYERLLVARSL